MKESMKNMINEIYVELLWLSINNIIKQQLRRLKISQGIKIKIKTKLKIWVDLKYKINLK